MVDNINKNTIGETDAKIKLNALNELKNAEIQNKCLSSNQKDLLELFDDLLEKISNNNNNNNSGDNIIVIIMRMRGRVAIRMRVRIRLRVRMRMIIIKMKMKIMMTMK